MSSILISLAVSQVVAQRHDQRRLVGIDGLVADVRRNIQHGANGKIDLVVPDHGQAITAGHVSELNVNVRVTFPEMLHQARQQVDDGGLAGRDHHFAAVQVTFHLAVEAGVQAFQPFDQGPGHFMQFLAFPGHVDSRAMPFEQYGVQFPLQRTDLQADGRLAEEQLFGGIGHLAAFGHGAKSTQLF